MIRVSYPYPSQSQEPLLRLRNKMAPMLTWRAGRQTALAITEEDALAPKEKAPPKKGGENVLKHRVLPSSPHQQSPSQSILVVLVDLKGEWTELSIRGRRGYINIRVGR